MLRPDQWLAIEGRPRHLLPWTGDYPEGTPPVLPYDPMAPQRTIDPVHPAVWWGPEDEEEKENDSEK